MSSKIKKLIERRDQLKRDLSELNQAILKAKKGATISIRPSDGYGGLALSDASGLARAIEFLESEEKIISDQLAPINKTLEAIDSLLEDQE